MDIRVCVLQRQAKQMTQTDLIKSLSQALESNACRCLCLQLPTFTGEPLSPLGLLVNSRYDIQETEIRSIRMNV